jgi:hypothetical protein
MALFKAFVASLLLVVVGCSTPDGDDMNSFIDKIRNMDPGPRKAARLEEARWRALEALRSERDPSDLVGKIRCADGVGNGMIEYIRVSHIIDCLAVTTQLTFALCVEARFADIMSNYTSANAAHGKPYASCEYEPDPSFAIDQKWDPEQITDEDLARTAFASQDGPPAWMIAAGIVGIGAGGIIVFASGWGAVLCPLDIEWGCPGDPLAPGESPQPGATSGGDR